MAFDLTIKIGGEGGEGVISAGDFLTESAARAGYYVVNFKSFPAEIKGGYAQSTIRVSNKKLYTTGDGFDILCCFNGEAYEFNRKHLRPGTVLVYDSSDFEPEEHEGVVMYPVPLSHLAKDIMKAYITKNVIALGVLCGLFDIPVQSIKDSIKAKFLRKGQEIIELNYKALETGINYVRENIKKLDGYLFPPAKEPKDVVIMEGNQAIAKGAVVAGCKFYAAYPITPATTVGNYIVEDLIRVGGWLYQAEDEIASLGMALGASFAGVKAMTATSGPGLCLMTEFISYAGMTELPIVIVDVQRVGPATGMPTKHEQGDLYHAIYSGHGEIPRAVLAPTNVEESFYLTVEAFNLAEKYQIPVIVLTDASLSLRAEAFPTPKVKDIKVINRWVYNAEDDPEGKFRRAGRFLRYALFTEDGITPMGVPGDPNAIHAITGLERQENSDPRNRPDIRTWQMDKRFKKMEKLLREDAEKFYEMDAPFEKADIGIISWGLTASATKEAVERLRSKGRKINALYPKLLWPLRVDILENFAKSCRRIIMPESNYSGQLATVLRAETRIRPISYCIYRGEPFIPREIEEFIEYVLENSYIEEGKFTPANLYGEKAYGLI
ncbi:pyruvate flavodoxin/ferredoxin oxidoreductase domain protein [Hydrogenobacter thermophilus TK-6]|uniref:2-oxoglutarate:ferredoxin oxidoreductase alpha subunit n=2 Tax=Hydrogenobacter thermophilus TaxID=940 RepID=D3DI99_HYDTT|nr:2-oxoacid:acceptor oxidoreductase subunit alpha [Hydrogenobacter thermophilus]ADO45478.1 pyruvate flavodoxin/ferredoxin oxidoreductase domain protein [Hydrogenobacter thermophilus TK-6]BAB21494.1 2-oxoglutarate ferredoxin oxidoreductase alpha subunit [Hydrogenobacter thermophilus TK-6]BAI69551.1 2-oxoglutarate:ferredoxin oxidoreductase alpha subunit [Hydrogenobacter thermophilus TK-6]